MQTGASSSSQSRMNRNSIERERRSQMRSLFSKLFTLLPPHPTKMPVPELLDYSTFYVRQLQKRMEELKPMKEQLLEPSNAVEGALISPVMNISEGQDSTIQVNFMGGIDMRFALCDIISILEQEGAQVLNASYHIIGNKIFLSIHSQAAYSRDGVARIQVHERLKRLHADLSKEFAA